MSISAISPALSGPYGPYARPALRFGADGVASAEPSAAAEGVADPGAAPQPPPVDEVAANEPDSSGKKLPRLLKTLVYNAIGVGLLMAPLLLPMRAGIVGMALSIVTAIPFVIAKDMISDHAARQGVKDYSNLRVLREVLDKNMRRYAESAFGRIPLIKAETRQAMLEKWMAFYNTRVSGILNFLGADSGIPELRSLPERLKEKKTRREKAEVLLITMMAVLKRAILVRGKLGLTARVARGGLLATLVFLPMSKLFDMVFGPDAQKAEEELRQFEAARAARAEKAGSQTTDTVA